MNFRYAMGAGGDGQQPRVPTHLVGVHGADRAGAVAGQPAIRGTGRSVRPTAWLLLGGLLGYRLPAAQLPLRLPAGRSGDAGILWPVHGHILRGVARLGFAALVVWCTAGEGGRLLVRSVATFLALAMGTALISWAPVGRLVNGTTASDSQAMRASYRTCAGATGGVATRTPRSGWWWNCPAASVLECCATNWVPTDSTRRTPEPTAERRSEPAAHSPYLRSPEQWAAEITEQDYDYVYVFKTSDEFVATYASLFGGPPTPLTVYRVNRDSAGPLLRKGRLSVRVSHVRGGGNSGMIPAGRCSNCRNDSAMAASNCTSSVNPSRPGCAPPRCQGRRHGSRCRTSRRRRR